MPELPEVETIVKDLNELIKGKKILEASVEFEKIIATDLSGFLKNIIGKKILKVQRLGKWIKFELSENCVMLAHLKMTGQFYLGPNFSFQGDINWPKHVRAALKLNGLPETENILAYKDIRKFGKLYFFKEEEFKIFFKKINLGVDALKIKEEDFFNLLKNRKKPLKAMLLDQSIIAGLGNIYADETLFAAKLLPQKMANTISYQEASILLKHIKSILTKAIEFRGSTVNNYQGLKGAGSFQNKHKIYGKFGKQCLICETIIEKTVIAGRSTSFCTKCQRG